MQHQVQLRFPDLQHAAPVSFKRSEMRRGGALFGARRLLRERGCAEATRKESDASDHQAGSFHEIISCRRCSSNGTTRRAPDSRLRIDVRITDGVGDLCLQPPTKAGAKQKRHALACRFNALILYFFTYFFAYHSEFVAVNACHLSGKSSSAKIAVTGHTGTQAPQSIHSVGLI